MPGKALCRTETCPAKEHCYRYTAEFTPSDGRGRFSVPTDKNRCDYYIPTKVPE
jgi:hypothetical protein